LNSLGMNENFCLHQVMMRLVSNEF
ncbi:hypothetical protein D046_3164B, partial [Vibrio parahaemolyticus V-223/04]